VYNFELLEKPNAATTFETLLGRFPTTEHEPEVLYLLYLINKDLEESEKDKYKQQLIEKYPKTTYAKLLLNPNYTEESTAANEKLKKVYNIAYEHYRQEKYVLARDEIKKGIAAHPEATFTPWLKLLEVMIIGKTEDINRYKFELSEFIKNNPDSDITEYANVLYEAAGNFEEDQVRRKGARYTPDFEQPHYFVIVYNASENLSDELISKLETFNDENFQNEGLNSGNLIINDDYAMVFIHEFGGLRTSLKYFDLFNSNGVTNTVISQSKMNNFVITKDNFNIFYQSKDLTNYLKFFSKFYQNGK